MKQKTIHVCTAITLVACLATQFYLYRINCEIGRSINQLEEWRTQIRQWNSEIDDMNREWADYGR